MILDWDLSCSCLPWASSPFEGGSHLRWAELCQPLFMCEEWGHSPHLYMRSHLEAIVPTQLSVSSSRHQWTIWLWPLFIAILFLLCFIPPGVSFWFWVWFCSFKVVFTSLLTHPLVYLLIFLYNCEFSISSLTLWWEKSREFSPVPSLPYWSGMQTSYSFCWR